MNYITEPARQLPVTGQYDVAVCGGGVGGVAAALAAARGGASVLLLEKNFLLGGLATLGIVTVYLPICDGRGRQICHGLAEELLHLSVKHGYEDRYPTPWLQGGSVEERARRRFEIQFNAAMCAYDYEEALLSEGVTLLYGTAVCDAVTQDGRITHLIVENKNGRSAIAVRTVVDATGDADVCHLAGEQTARFTQGNVLAGWCYEYRDGGMHLHMIGASDVPDKQKTAEQRQADTRRRYSGLEAAEITEMATDSHRMTAEFFLKNGGIRPDHRLAAVPVIPQIRMTRRVEGAYVMDDTEMHRAFADSVGLFSDWRRSGPVYELPFSILHGSRVKNLICAGRILSVTDAMWDITRVIPVCAVSGEAAGTAAAMADDFTAIDIEILQQKLRAQGVRLHESEL